MSHRLVSRRLAAALALAATPLAAACDDSPTAILPGQPGERYQLARVADQALPWVLPEEGGVTRALVGGTIELRADSRAERSMTWRTTTADAPPVVETFTWTQRYVADGAAIRFVVDCPPNANCVPDEVGLQVGGIMTLRFELPTGAQDPAYVYERIPEE